MRCKDKSKDPSRKTRKRSPARKPPDDDELAQLASVLAEYQLDNNVFGWFRLPWYDGRWAATLARTAAPLVGDVSSLECRNAIELIDGYSWASVTHAYRKSDAYEHAGLFHQRLVQPNINTNSSRLLAASMRCMQLAIANSDGGGHVYNELLISAFGQIEPEVVAESVLEFRCADAIGTTHHLQGDRNDRQRAAFTIAWRRGLYLAAYAVPPAF